MLQWRAVRSVARSSSCTRQLRLPVETIGSTQLFHTSSSNQAAESKPPSKPSFSQRGRNAQAARQVLDVLPNASQKQPQEIRPREVKLRPSAANNLARRGGRGATPGRGGPKGANTRRRDGDDGKGRARPRRREIAEFEDDENEEDYSNSTVDEYGAPVGDLDEATPDNILEIHENSFVHDAELDYYATIMKVVEETNERAVKADRMLEQGKNRSNQEMITRAEAELKAVQADLAWGLQHLQEMYAEVSPSHVPRDLDVQTFRKGEIGGLAVGRGSAGFVIEDALRLLSQREGHQWMHKTQLKEKLESGEFVKFRSGLERKWTLKIPSAREIGFEPLDEDAKRALVTKVVQGHYADPAEQKIENKIAKDAARLASGTYDRRSKSALLDTISSLLPNAAQKS